MRASRYAILAAALGLSSLPASALPEGYKQKDLISGLDAVASAVLPDGRVLAIEKYGKVHLIKDGVRQTTAFMDWESRTMSRFEKGMMAIIADPNFATNKYIYVQYCKAGGNGTDQVSRFTVNGDVVDPASEKLIMSLGDAGANYHHGSGLLIADGKLYIGSGNRGGIGDAGVGPANAGNRNVVMGKILRVNIPEGDIPSDNPFYTQNTGDARAVFAWGLRNPFTMSYNPTTKAIWFSHVMSNAGDDAVHELVAGQDYGYYQRAGRTPLWTASSSGTGGRAMIGSLWYTGTNFTTEWRGMYYFGGINVQQLRAMPANRTGGAKNFSAFNCPIDVQQDLAGAIYVTTRCQTEDSRYGTGKVTKVWYGDTEPTVTRDMVDRHEANRRMAWKVRAGGAVQVDLKESGRQSVELRSVSGRLLATAHASDKGTAELRAPGAVGTHLLVWKNGSARASAKVVLH